MKIITDLIIIIICLIFIKFTSIGVAGIIFWTIVSLSWVVFFYFDFKEFVNEGEAA